MRSTGVRTMEEHVFKEWSGKVLAFGFKHYIGEWPTYVPGKGHAVSNIDDLTHEFAHYLVSPHYAKDVPYFGLGHPARISGFRLFHHTVCSAIEEQASILGILMLAKIDGLEAANLSAGNQNWDSGSVDSQIERFDELRKKKLVRKADWKLWQTILEFEWSED